jgi:hypothetical protein
MIATPLAPLALVVLLAASCGDNDKKSATPGLAMLQNQGVYVLVSGDLKMH